MMALLMTQKKHVREWINSKEIEIKYIFQKNKGKQLAHNLAVEKCETEFLFVLILMIISLTML